MNQAGPDSPHDQLPFRVDPERPWLMMDATGRPVLRLDSRSAVGQLRDEDYGNGQQIEEATKAYAEGTAPALQTMRGLQLAVVAWADKAFPNRTPHIAFLKLFEEIGELVKHPGEPLEYADVILLLMDLASMHGITDLAGAIVKKLAINAERQWAVTGLGVMQHTEEGVHKLLP